MTTTISRQWRKFRNKNYREQFVAEQVRRVIPAQIRAIMNARGWSQQQLAEQAGLTQGVISRAANPAYGKLTLNTVIRIAAGLDVAFVGVFVPFTELERFFNTISDEKLGDVAPFEKEDRLLRDAEIRTQATKTRPQVFVDTSFDSRLDVPFVMQRASLRHYQRINETVPNLGIVEVR